MSFFEQYWAALDGPDPSSSFELVADDMQFCIHWSNGDEIFEYTGGQDELRGFLDRRKDPDRRHHIFWSARDGDTEFAAGELRHEDGTRLGTYTAMIQLDADGRMARYFAARTPVSGFSAIRSP